MGNGKVRSVEVSEFSISARILTKQKKNEIFLSLNSEALQTFYDILRFAKFEV